MLTPTESAGQATLWLLTLTSTANMEVVLVPEMPSVQKDLALKYAIFCVALCERGLSEDAHNPV